MSKIRLFRLLLLLLTFHIGCKRTTNPAPPLETLSYQILVDTFQAIHKREHELAITRLEKFPEGELRRQLLLREQEQQAILYLQETLIKGSIEDAKKEIRNLLSKIGMTPRIKLILDIIDQLEILHLYLASCPFSTGEEAWGVFSRIPPPGQKGMPLDDPYKSWYENQLKRIQQQRKKEANLLQSWLLAEIDKAFILGDPKLGFLLAQYRLCFPQSLLSQWKEVNPITFQEEEDVVNIVDQEIALVFLFFHQPEKLNTFFSHRIPKSLTGWYGKIGGALFRHEWQSVVQSILTIHQIFPQWAVWRLKPLLIFANCPTPGSNPIPTPLSVWDIWVKIGEGLIKEVAENLGHPTHSPLPYYEFYRR